LKNFCLKIWDKLKQPKAVWIALFFVCSILLITGTILLVIFVPKHTVGHYLLYFISAVCLTYFVYLLVVIIPKIRMWFKTKSKRFKFTNNFINNYNFRAVCFAIGSLLITATYVFAMGFIAIKDGSIWFGVFTIYYIILSGMRTAVLWSAKYTPKEKQINQYLVCGILLLILNITLAVVVGCTFKMDLAGRYSGIMIYVAATYTFYRLGLGVYNICKAKKVESFIVKSIKKISFADSLVSLFVLQVSLLYEFSTANHTYFNLATGMCVCAGLIATGVYMIVRYARIKKVTKEVYNEEK